MSSAQKFFIGLFPRWAKDIEAESRRWMMRGECGHEYSVWDAGGVRWKAGGNPRRYRRCLQCGRASWHVVYKKEA